MLWRRIKILYLNNSFWFLIGVVCFVLVILSVASLTLMGGVGLLISLPFALRAGAEFFLPVTAALVVAIALVPMLEWFERRGVPSKPMMLRFTRYVRSRSVVANKCAINCSTSTRLERGTITMRVGCS